LIVDFIPASQRPYIGSSENNTETELIIGYNGIARLFGSGRDSNGPSSRNGGPGGTQAPANGIQGGPANGYSMPENADQSNGQIEGQDSGTRMPFEGMPDGRSRNDDGGYVPMGKTNGEMSSNDGTSGGMTAEIEVEAAA
jgi:hypothetical protein